MGEEIKGLSQDEAGKSGEESTVNYWLKQVAASLKREKDYRDEARRLVQIYEGRISTHFNILYANTETLSPAIYNSPPRPDTRPRAKHPDPVADAAAGLVDAYLLHFIDHGDSRYCSFDQANREVLEQALVTGRGCQRFHYRSNVEYEGEGEARRPKRVKDEIVYAEPLDWDKVCFGYSKNWKGVPWVCFVHAFTRDEAVEELGAEVAGFLKYDRREEDGERKAEDEDAEPTATVYELWDKRKRQTFMVSPGVKEWVRAPKGDPYKLQNFFPIQEPLLFGRQLSVWLPIPIYRLYRQQAQELNKVTERIERLVEGMKVRGFYDSTVEELKTVLEAGDNEMRAIQILNQMGQGAKVDNAIWLVPIEKHITVLQQLIIHRQQIKQVIYEIMGIADIMRGSTAASETLGAQELKNRWGTMRLKKFQGRCAAYIRDGLRIATELAFSKLGPDTLRIMTGSTLPSAKELQQMEQAVQAASAAGQEPPPELMETMALPAFEECLALLKHDIYRKFAVDIETNSTIDVEATEDKESIAEFLNAMAQFLSGIGPLVEQGILPFEAAKGMMIAISRRFRLGRDLEEWFKKMQPPAEGGGAEEEALQKERQKLMQDQMKLAQDRVKFQIEQMKAKMEQMKASMQQEMDGERLKMELEKMMMEIERLIMGMENTQQQGQMQMERQGMQLEMQGQRQSAELDMKGQQLDLKEKQAGMNDQVRNAKFDTKQTVAQEKQKAQQAKQQPQSKRK